MSDYGYGSERGCVVPPGVNMLRPGEIAIRVNACMKCGGTKGLPDMWESFNTYVGMDAAADEEGMNIADGIKWGVLCGKHIGLATYRMTGRKMEKL